MKKLFLILFLLFVNVTYAQQRPTVYKAYLNKEDKFIIDNLILSSDSSFFSFASCECGQEYYGKGKWEIKGERLYLSGFDSTKAFPHATIDKVNVEISTDSVTIKAYDYFHKPLKNLIVELIYQASSNFQTMPQSVDKTGKLTISKKDYSGFYLIYEARDESGLLNKENYHYSFEKNTKEIIVHINFAAASFDRQPIPFNFGNQSFILGDRKLLTKDGKTAFLETSYYD